MHFVRTFLLMASLTGLFVAVGGLIGGQVGMLFALAFAMLGNLFAWYNSSRMALSAHRAYPADPYLHRDYIRLVEQLVDRTDLPMPEVYVIPADQPNAFATGRNPEHSAVAVTEGLLKRLSKEELAGVIAHELAHIEHRDTLTMTISATLAGAISALAQFGLFFGARDERANPLLTIAAVIFAPIAAMMIQMAVSRSREYAADRRAAEICGTPNWLASALHRLQDMTKHIRFPRAEQKTATAHLFIANPLRMDGIGALFSTHPPMESRISALLAMTDIAASPIQTKHDGGQGHSKSSLSSKDSYNGPWG